MINVIIEECEIINIETIDNKDEYVYNFEVENNHNYFADNILVSNCHCLRSAAASVLLKVLEEPPDVSMFILCTTEPQKILPTIRSRCQRFDLNRIEAKEIAKHLLKICRLEDRGDVDPKAIALIAKSAQGSVRDALSMLDAVISRCDSKITEEQVSEIIGKTNFGFCLSLYQSISEGNYAKTIQKATEAINSGIPPQQIFADMQEFLHDLLIGKCVESDKHIYEEETLKKIWREELKKTNSEYLVACNKIINSHIVNIDNMQRLDLYFDICVIELVRAAKKLNKK